MDPDARPDQTGVYEPGYFETRLAQDPNREKVWRHLCDHLSRYVRPDADVLELGAGWCDFSNFVKARRVVAMDLDATVVGPPLRTSRPRSATAPTCRASTRTRSTSCSPATCSSTSTGSSRPGSWPAPRGCCVPGGRLILMQPNFRLNPGRYFDDFTHVSVFTDQSLSDYLASLGWSIEVRQARFMPLTLKSRGSGLSFLVPWYLRSPIKPLAGQMLIVANPGK